MSGARPKVFSHRTPSSSSDEDSEALCRVSDLEGHANALSDGQTDQDDLQLSLAHQQCGPVQGVSYTGQVEGRDNVLLQPGAHSVVTFHSPLIQHVTHVTYADGTQVTYEDNGEDPLSDAHLEAIDGPEDMASVRHIPTHCPPTRGRRPQHPSAGQLEWLKWHLKRLYRTKLGEFQPLPWFDDLHLQLKDVYTNLQIVHKDRADTDLQFRLSGRLRPPGYMFYSSAKRRGEDSGLIRIEQIFGVNRNGEIVPMENQGEQEETETERPKRIRIEGPPGIGKSIQCRKLAYDWSNDSFQQFDFTFLLQMRYLSGDVKDAIFEQLLPDDTDIDREGLWSYLKQVTYQSKVLFILDGLDELKPQVRQTSDVIRLIQERLLADATVVVTSRPHECTADLKGCALHCNIKGYTKANSHEYIQKYFHGRPEIVNSLWKRIAADEKLVELATNPLNTMLLCIVWEDNGGSLPSTITGLFSSLILCILKRYCSKNDVAITGTTIPDDVYSQLAEMGRVAWEGCLRNEVHFDEAEFRSLSKDRDLLKFGFLTKDLGASRIEASFVWSFLHKTFQEYFAAVCLSTYASVRESCGGCVPTGTFEFIPPQLFLVEPRVRRIQANAPLPETSSNFKDHMLEAFKDNSLHQVCLFLVGMLKTRSQPVFECFSRRLQALRSSDDDNAKDDHRSLFKLCIQCLIESENGQDLIRALSPCIHNAIDVSDIFPDSHDKIWRLGLSFILKAQFPWVTRVDINLSSHEVDKELADAFVTNRFLTHLSITKMDLDDMYVLGPNAKEESFPLLAVLGGAQSLRVFFARIFRLTTHDRELSLMSEIFHSMSHAPTLFSIMLKLYMEEQYPEESNCPDKLRLPFDLLASCSTLTLVKIWMYGAFHHHPDPQEYYYAGDSDNSEGVYGTDELEYYGCESVDDRPFNESVGRLLRESRTIQTFNLQMIYRCTVFEHAKNLPSVLAGVISVTEVLRHILLHFSFYHKQKGRKNPITYRELTRLHVFPLLEALAHNKTLRTFELFIDDAVPVPRRDKDSLRSFDLLANSHEDVLGSDVSADTQKSPESVGPSDVGSGAVGPVSDIVVDADDGTLGQGDDHGQGGGAQSNIESFDSIIVDGATPADTDAEPGRSSEDVGSGSSGHTSLPHQAQSNQSHTPTGTCQPETDQVRLWPSIASVFRSITVLRELNLTFKYCLTESTASVQTMAYAIVALKDNNTLRTVKLAVILYRFKFNTLFLNTSVSGIGNVDEAFRALGNVVSANTTLTCLHFHKLDDPWRSASRARVMTSLFRIDAMWHVTVSKPALECLASAIQRNMVLTEFSVVGFSSEDEGAKEVVEEMNSSARDNLNITVSIS